MAKVVTTRAISAATGMQYPFGVSQEMAKLGFSSNIWLTEKQLMISGVSIEKAQQGKAFKYSIAGNCLLLYNASQTTRPDEIERLTGRLKPTNLFTDFEIRDESARTLTQNIGNYQKSEWITAQQVEALGLDLKSGAKTVTTVVNLPHKNGQTEKLHCKVKFYNVAELKDLSILHRMKTMLPISAKTGRKYKANLAMQLLNFAIRNGFSSPFWITQSLIKDLKLQISADSKPYVVSMMNAANTKSDLELYNASQTDAPHKVAAHAYEQTFRPRSAISGSHFPKDIASILNLSSMRSKLESVYWLTKNQAATLGVDIISGQEPTEIYIGMEKRLMYNGDQTTNKTKIESRFS